MHIIKHFKRITNHRLLVMKMCFQCGLYWRGLTHDLSKYSKAEFLEGAKYYVETHSSVLECQRKTGKSEAWLHHKGRNPHHPEYWVDKEGPIMMPYAYVVESICDRIAAGKTFKKKKFKQTFPLKYWYDHLDFSPVHEKTARFYERVFTDLARKGEPYILNKKYMKNTYKEICEDQKSIKINNKTVKDE